MKKKIIRSVAIAALTAPTFTAYDDLKPQADKKSEGVIAVVPTDIKVVYVEVDSTMTQYKFCRDYSLILQKEGQNTQNTLTGKQKQLEQATANFQQKLQQNAYTHDQTEFIQVGSQKQSADLQAPNQCLSNESQTEADECNKVLRDPTQYFLTNYNRDKRCSLVLSRAGDGLLYAGKSYNTTKDVVTGLNKAYKPISTKKEANIRE